MNFANLPLGWALLGVAALAAGLFALQRLRVRHRPVEVETTLFWQQALEESRARVLTQRFRHPWAYALVLAIALLLWLSFAGLRGDDGDRRDHLVLIDGSAAMATGERFRTACELATAHAESLPQGARTVVLCGGRPRTVLRPGEQALLLARRLDGEAPVAAPNGVAAALRAHVRGRPADARPLSVVVVGDAQLRAADLAALPDSVDVQRLAAGARASDNRGVTALGARAAVSGRWDVVDVLVEVHADRGDAPRPALTLDGRAWTGTSRDESADGRSRFTFVDVPARGELLRVSLPGGDALALDDAAALRLPDRRPIAVAIGPGVPDVVRDVVAADPGLVARPDGARAAIRVAGSSFGGPDLPAIELSDPSTSDDAFLVFHPEDLAPADVLDELYRGLGLDEIDAMAAARTAGRQITMGARPSPRRALWLWRELLNDDYDFVRSRAFPLFVGLGVRWLVEFDEGPARVAAGEPVAIASGDVRRDDAVAGRAFGASFAPPVAGDYLDAAARPFSASLLAPQASAAAASAAFADVAELAGPGAAGPDLTSVLLVLALLLLGTEWVLHRTGRMP